MHRTTISVRTQSGTLIAYTPGRTYGILKAWKSAIYSLAELILTCSSVGHLVRKTCLVVPLTTKCLPEEVRIAYRTVTVGIQCGTFKDVP